MSDNIIDMMLALKKALQRERQQKLLLLTFILLSAIVLSCCSMFQQEARLSNILLVSALIALLSALLFLRDILRFWKPESSPILQMLHQAPKNIVWIYLVEVNIAPFGIRFSKEQTLCLRLLNGDMLQIRLSEKDIPLVMSGLEKQLPHASFGFNKEKEQWYNIHPSLLYRDDLSE